MRQFNRVWRWALLLLAMVVIALTLLITRRQANTLAQEERERIALWAEATQSMASADETVQDFTFLLRVIQANNHVPAVLTDANRYALATRNVPARYMQDPTQLAGYVEELAQEHEPIVITLPSGVQNFLYYGTSNTLRELRYYPYLQLLFIGAIAVLGYLLFRQNRAAEQSRIWVGMAKETAHQLGTPISSLMAWTRLLEEDEYMPEFTESLNLDIDRLQRVANRFSKIGAIPQLDDSDLAATIASSVSYMQPRIPKGISLTFCDSGDVSEPVPHNSVLMQWVVENLIRNSVDAIHGEGHITLRLHYERGWAVVDCEDTGKGIGRNRRRSVFRPGYSTKTRGWGLGLSLARRIVRSYHRGSIFVLRSELGKGTTFRFTLRTGELHTQSAPISSGGILDSQSMS